MTHIVIEIRGGVIANVISDNDDMQVITIDYDDGEHYFGYPNQIMDESQIREYVDASETEAYFTA